MIKKIVFGVIAFVIGVAIDFYAQSFFREQIQNIFLWSTSGSMKFHGKNFYPFGSNFSFFSFGLAFSLFLFANLKQIPKRIIRSGVLSTLIFVVLVIIISSIDANIKVAECTACENGIRSIRWNDINYGRILGVSILISVIPSMIFLMENRKE